MQKTALTAAIALLAIFFPIAGQQHPAPAHERATPAKASTPARVSDAQIDAAIRLKMTKSKIASDKFRFKVQGGVVTVEGKTDVIQHKGAATRMARTAGAVAVNNHIEISEAAKEKAADNLEKGRRRAQIVRGEPRSDTKPPRVTVAAAARKSDSTAVQKR
jgi:hypothetical protein